MPDGIDLHLQVSFLSENIPNVRFFQKTYSKYVNYQCMVFAPPLSFMGCGWKNCKNHELYRLEPNAVFVDALEILRSNPSVVMYLRTNSEQ